MCGEMSSHREKNFLTSSFYISIFRLRENLVADAFYFDFSVFCSDLSTSTLLKLRRLEGLSIIISFGEDQSAEEFIIMFNYGLTFRSI